MNHSKVEAMITDLYNQLADNNLTLDEMVRLNLAVVSLAFVKAGATYDMLPLIIKDVNKCLIEYFGITIDALKGGTNGTC